MMLSRSFQAARLSLHSRVSYSLIKPRAFSTQRALFAPQEPPKPLEELKTASYSIRDQFGFYLVGGLILTGGYFAVRGYIDDKELDEKEYNSAEKSSSSSLPASSTTADKTISKPPARSSNVPATTNSNATTIPDLGMIEEEPVDVLPSVPLPEHVTYLIVGAGTAAFAAYRAIRSNDPKAKVLLIGDEHHAPYMRPPLSKEMWYNSRAETADNPDDIKFKQWNGRDRSIFYEKNAFYYDPSTLEQSENGGVGIAKGRKVVRLNLKEQSVTLDDGQSVKYDKCLLATGGTPKQHPAFIEAPQAVRDHTTLYRSVRDYQRLDKITDKAESVAIIGGGFMGSELACALGNKSESKRKFKVIQSFTEPGNMGKVLPRYLSIWATNKVAAEGVVVKPNTYITKADYCDKTKKVLLDLNDGERLAVDHVVVAVGLEPNVQLAKDAGLEVDPKHGGFLVNAELEARRNVWVAGDAACFYDTHLGRRRVEHHDHAVVSGRLAGENMTGAAKPYWHQSMFWSDLGPEVGYEAIGVVDSELPTVSVFAKATKEDTPKSVVEATGDSVRSETEQNSSTHVVTTAQRYDTPLNKEDYSKGVVFYLRENVVVGVLLWNVFNKMAIARQIIKEGKEYDDLSEVAKQFNLYGDPQESTDPTQENSADEK